MKDYGLIVSIISGFVGLIVTVAMATWRLAIMMGSIQTNVALNSVKTEEINKDVITLTEKLEGAIIQINSLQARTIRLEEKVDKLQL